MACSVSGQAWESRGSVVPVVIPVVIVVVVPVVVDVVDEVPGDHDAEGACGGVDVVADVVGDVQVVEVIEDSVVVDDALLGSRSRGVGGVCCGRAGADWAVSRIVDRSSAIFDVSGRPG